MSNIYYACVGVHSGMHIDVHINSYVRAGLSV